VYDAEQASASSDAPKTDAPKTDTPKTDTPDTDAAETDDPAAVGDGDGAGSAATEQGIEPAHHELPPLIPPGTRESPAGPPGHRRRRRWRRVVAWTAGGLAILLLVVAAGGYAAYRYYNGRIDHVDIVKPGIPEPKTVVTPPGTENYLLVGVDSGRTGLGAGDVEGKRSDTTILAHLDKNGTTTLLSFPRDMYVTIPTYTDNDGVKHEAHKDKFNAAISDGGEALLRATVEKLTQIHIDHYVEVDLEGFRSMSNAIGGVQVCLKSGAPFEYDNNGSISTNLNDGFSQFHGTTGENTLKGANALSFVRQRYGLPNADIDRIKRQQVFLSAVLRKALSTSVLLNPTKLLPLLSAATSALSTDNGTGVSDLRKLANRLRGLDPSKVFLETVKTRSATLDDPGAYQDPSNPNLIDIGSAGAVQIYFPDALEAQLAPLRDSGSTPAASPSVGASASGGASPSTGAAPSTGASASPSTGASAAPSAGSSSPGASSGASSSASPSATPTRDTAADAGTCANPIY
jgi:LCP family protein required for cell wall assembly